MPCEADFVDVGVGMIQCGPYHCTKCGASQIGPYDAERSLTDREQNTGWYEPGSLPGSSANVVSGKVVSHNVAKQLYQERFTGSADYDKPGYVEQWWKDLRQKLPDDF